MSTTVVTYFRDKTFLEKLVLKKSFWALLVIFGFTFPLVKSIFRELPPELPILYKLNSYVLTDENGKEFGSNNLKGKVYIANFAFTSCPTICPDLMKKTQIIQKRIRGLGDRAAIVTFTVDPETDTPQTLFKYARELNANPYIWSFLTGPEEKLKDLINNGFKVPLGEKAQTENIYDITHSGKFVLVDGKNQIRGYYGDSKQDINKLMIDLGLLVNRTQIN